jgi:DNA-binding response OmpR family regulator
VPTVLIVDDEANQVRVLAAGLRLEGFEVRETRSADEAVKALEESPVDLAIVDLMLPGRNGLELAREIRRHHPLVRVVLTSAYHMSERQLTRADCGVIGFIPKPYSLGELCRFLRGKLSAVAEAPRSATQVMKGPGEEVRRA